MVTIHVAGFQTVAIFMQTRIPEKPATTAAAISDVVNDSQHKVII